MQCVLACGTGIAVTPSIIDRGMRLIEVPRIDLSTIETNKLQFYTLYPFDARSWEFLGDVEGTKVV